MDSDGCRIRHSVVTNPIDGCGGNASASYHSEQNEEYPGVLVAIFARSSFIGSSI